MRSPLANKEEPVQETLNVLIFCFLGIALAAAATAIYFRFRKPVTAKNNAVVGYSCAVISASYTASVVSAWVLIGLKPSFMSLFIVSVPIYLAWKYLGKQNPDKRKTR